MNIDPRPGESTRKERPIILVGRRDEAVKVRGMFLHLNRLRFTAAQVPGVRAVQAVITRPEGADEAAVGEGLRAAVQGMCRVGVDEVGSRCDGCEWAGRGSNRQLS